jgi:hypothetical protein
LGVDRVLQRLRQIGEKPRHLLLALEILFRRELAWSTPIAEHVALRDADPRLVRFVVVGREKLDRMRRDHRQPERDREADRARDKRLGLRLPSALQFDIEALRKALRPLGGKPLRDGIIAGEQRLADVPRRGAGERDQSLARRLIEPVAPQFWASAVLIVQPGTRQQFTEA